MGEDPQARPEAPPADDQFPAIAQEQVVWMFGTRRTGSTWLGFMLRDLPGGHKWGEPLIGGLIGDFYYNFEDKTGKNHIFSPVYRDLWQSWIRRLVCEGAAARAPDLVSSDGFMVIRDPHGTNGAPVLCEAMPASRLLILVRDPRDIVASMADAHQSGGWMASGRRSRAASGAARAPTRPRTIRSSSRAHGPSAWSGSSNRPAAPTRSTRARRPSSATRTSGSTRWPR